MKSMIGQAILLGLAAATASVVGCSSSPSPSTGSTGGQQPGSQGNVVSGETGTVAGKLTLADGTLISTVKYQLANGATIVQSGTLNVANSQGVSFQLGQVPAGSGYVITLSASSADGGVTCTGSSGSFSVTAHSTVNETLNLICTNGISANGNVLTRAVIDYCGTWQSVSTIGPGLDAGPTNGSEVLADGITPVLITVTASGANPSQLAYHWSTTTISGNGITLGANSGQGTTTDVQTVTCNNDATDAVGHAQATVVISDSTTDGGAANSLLPDGGTFVCDPSLTTVTTDVFCDKIASCAGGATSTQCGDAGLNCKNLTNDNSNCGACGTVCTGGQTCQASVCACASGSSLCGGTTCVPLNTNTNCGACGVACTGTATCTNNGGTFSCQAPVCTASNQSGCQSACNSFAASHTGSTAVAGTCNGSELAAFLVDGTGSCMACMTGAGQCLNSTGTGNTGLDCEDPFTGQGAGETTAQCLSTLTCDLGVTPARTPAPASANGPISGYCAGVAEPTCVSGTPGGLCVSVITAGFPSTFTPSNIGGNIAVATFASGRAGAAVNCAFNNCSACLAGSAF